MGMPSQIERCSIIETRGDDDERVSLPMPNRVAHPGWVGIFRERAAVGENLSKNSLILIKDHDEIRCLNDFHRKGKPRYTGLRAGRETPDPVGILAKIIPSVARVRRGPPPYLLRLEIRRDKDQITSLLALPDSRQVWLAIFGSYGRRRQIGLIARCPAQSGGRMIRPLS